MNSTLWGEPMEVYVENNVTGAGRWLAIPQNSSTLMYVLIKHKLSSNGEYQLTYIKLDNFDIQPCVGNLFILNKKLSKYIKLPEKVQSTIYEYSFNNGITFEEAVCKFL